MCKKRSLESSETPVPI